jgi:hypothetical protein
MPKPTSTSTRKTADRARYVAMLYVARNREENGAAAVKLVAVISK